MIAGGARRRPGIAIATAAGLLAVVAAGRAGAATITLGDQDFVDGTLVGGGAAAFNAASVGEPAPFDQVYGTDFISAPAGNFSKSFTFNYAATTVTSASLTFGILDNDAFRPGNQVASFDVNGLDLTAPLNALFEAHGGANGEYDVYTIVIPAAALSLLDGGAATFSLTLQGAPLEPITEPQTGNAAGLDFASLTLNAPVVGPGGTSVPLPAAAFAFAFPAAIAAAVLAGRRASRRLANDAA